MKRRELTISVGGLVVASVVVLALLVCPTLANAQQIQIVAFGHSGVTGNGKSSATGISGGVPMAEAWPALIERNLRSRGWDVKVTNKGIAGDTAARALRRVDADVPQGTTLTLIWMGENEVRAGAKVEDARKDVEAVAQAAQKKSSRILLLAQRQPDPPLRFVVTWISGTYDPKTFYPIAQYDSGDKEHLNAAGNELIAQRAVPDLERVLAELGFKPNR